MNLKTAIENAKLNNQLAFNFLLDNFWGDVYGYLIIQTSNENDAEDITIQTFSKAFDKIDTYNSDYKFKTWLITIAKNLYRDTLRKKKKSIGNETSKEDQERVYWIMDDAPSAEDKLINEQNLAKLLKDIKKLKPYYQQVIHLRFFQEYTYDEIAQEMNASISSVKVRLLRAKKLLAQIILNT